MQELGASFDSTSDIPAGMEDDVAQYREALLDAAVELDDNVMEAYLEVELCAPNPRRLNKLVLKPVPEKLWLSSSL